MTDFYDLYERQKERQPRMKKFWECYVGGTNGGRHYRHWTLQSAQTEAERLARLSNVRGEAVYLFECVGICRAEPLPVKWEVLR